MLTNLVKRLTRLEPVSPVRKGIVSLSIGDFSEEQLLALPMLCRAREIGRRSEIGCEISVLTPVCAAPLPQPNPWKAQTLYGLLALFANDLGRAIDGLLTLRLPGPAARERGLRFERRTNRYLCLPAAAGARRAGMSWPRKTQSRGERLTEN